MAKKTELKEQAETSEEKSNSSTLVIVAIIGLAGTVITALVTGFFGLLNTKTEIVLPASLTQTAQALLSTNATTTLTPTATPISSPTFTITPDMMATITATNTPERKVDFITPKKDELYVLPLILSDYIDSGKPNINSYYITVKSNESFIWKFYWCAKYQGTLQENLTLIKFNFMVDDVKIAEENFLKYENESKGWKCQTWAIILTQWTQGDTIKLSALYNIPRPMTDGENNYQPGDYRHDIFITVK
jgi:hypothetical protein